MADRKGVQGASSEAKDFGGVDSGRPDDTIDTRMEAYQLHQLITAARETTGTVLKNSSPKIHEPDFTEIELRANAIVAGIKPNQPNNSKYDWVRSVNRKTRIYKNPLLDRRGVSGYPPDHSKHMIEGNLAALFAARKLGVVDLLDLDVRVWLEEVERAAQKSGVQNES